MVIISVLGDQSAVLSECSIQVDSLRRVDGVGIPAIQPVPVPKFAVKCIHGFVNGGSAEAVFRSVCAHVN